MITNQGLKKALAIRKAQKTEDKAFDLKEFLFPEQLAFVEDPALEKIALCSRRSGKTIACAADLIKTAIESPGVVCLYITLSRNNAKKIVWKELKKINRNYNLRGEENLSELSITFPNGSTVYLSGAKDMSEIEKFRGLALKLVYIDEAQSFRAYIKDLVDEAIGPTLADYSGKLCLIGTPPPVPNGYFYETFTNNKNSFAKHAWTFWNNPFLVKTSGKSHQQILDRELSRRGVESTDPSIRREWFGECVVDSNSLLIHYDKLKNNYDMMPQPSNMTYILGVDIGFNDADALAVLAWGDHTPNVYLVEEHLATKQDITSLMNNIETLRKKYPISKMVIDAGALGKKITEELVRRHQIPLEAADKARKMENIALLNDFLRTGRFKAKPDSKFAQDSFLVEIDRDKSTPERIKVSDRYHSDIIDAVLYAFKKAYAYTYEEAAKKPRYGSKEWADQQQNDMFEAERDGLIEEYNKDKFGWGD